MLGVCLLFVGIVLINNGMCALYHVTTDFTFTRKHLKRA